MKYHEIVWNIHEIVWIVNNFFDSIFDSLRPIYTIEIISKAEKCSDGVENKNSLEYFWTPQITSTE